MERPLLSTGDEPISVTLTLPFALQDVEFFIAILACAAVVGLAAWLAHLWSTYEPWKAFVEWMDRLGLARRGADDVPALRLLA